jgi:hypothetical protein
MKAVRCSLLGALAVVGLQASSVHASADRCSPQDRDALLVGAIVRGVKNHTTGTSAPASCFAVGLRWMDTTEDPVAPSDRVLARVRRIVRPHRVAARTDPARKEMEGCTSWEAVTVGEPRCRGNFASVSVSGEHCAPAFERVGSHWEARPQPCE